MIVKSGCLKALNWTDVTIFQNQENQVQSKWESLHTFMRGDAVGIDGGYLKQQFSRVYHSSKCSHVNLNE